MGKYSSNLIVVIVEYAPLLVVVGFCVMIAWILFGPTVQQKYEITCYQILVDALPTHSKVASVESALRNHKIEFSLEIDSDVKPSNEESIQAIVRDTSRSLVEDGSVGMTFKFKNGCLQSSSVYNESTGI